MEDNSPLLDVRVRSKCIAIVTHFIVLRTHRYTYRSTIVGQEYRHHTKSYCVYYVYEELHGIMLAPTHEDSHIEVHTVGATSERTAAEKMEKLIFRAFFSSKM